MEPAELNTERLLLRPFRIDDVDDVLAYAADPEWARFLPPVPLDYTRRHAEEFIARAVLAPWETNPIFAVVLASTVIGGINVRVNVQDETAELGYSIGRPYWGKGLMPEAAEAVIDWAFEEYSLAKVAALAELRNERSWRVMEKLGMKREGVLRSDAKGRDGRVDNVYYGLLREEWKQREGERP